MPAQLHERRPRRHPRTPEYWLVLHPAVPLLLQVLKAGTRSARTTHQGEAWGAQPLREAAQQLRGYFSEAQQVGPSSMAALLALVCTVESLCVVSLMAENPARLCGSLDCWSSLEGA